MHSSKFAECYAEFLQQDWQMQEKINIWTRSPVGALVSLNTYSMPFNSRIVAKFAFNIKQI